MANHPINDLMTTSMESIKEMIDVNTIIGDAVTAPDGQVIIPVSKVSFGLTAGGGEYQGSIDFSETAPGTGVLDNKYIVPVKYPFAGGSGAGVSITPVAFIVAGKGNIQLIPISSSTVTEKLIDMIPDVVNKINNIVLQKCKDTEEADSN